MCLLPVPPYNIDYLLLSRQTRASSHSIRPSLYQAGNFVFFLIHFEKNRNYVSKNFFKASQKVKNVFKEQINTDLRPPTQSKKVLAEIN